jgi:acyl carrier protein
MKRFLGRSLQGRVIALVHEVRPEIPKSSLGGEVRLRQDLGFDSLSLVALSMRLHQDLGVDLVALAERAPDIVTVDDLVAVVSGITDARS